MNRIRNIVLFVTISTVMCVFISSLFKIITYYMYDNNLSWEEGLFTDEYPFSTVLRLKRELENNKTVSCRDLTSIYGIEIKNKRKFPGGYYFIIKTSGSYTYTYIFYNEDLRVSAIYSQTHFKEKEDYAFIEPGVTTMEDMHQFDRGFFTKPTSSMLTEIYVTKTEYLIITYDAHKNSGHIVLNYSFFDYDSLPGLYGDEIYSDIPYIYEKDRFI